MRMPEKESGGAYIYVHCTAHILYRRYGADENTHTVTTGAINHSLYRGSRGPIC